MSKPITITRADQEVLDPLLARAAAYGPDVQDLVVRAFVAGKERV